MTIKYKFDRLGHTTDETTVNKDGKTAQWMHYDWNEFGQLTRKVAQVGIEANVQNFTYDPLGRLATAVNPAKPELNEAYTYDASGNITQKTVGGKVVKMEYDLANQIVSSSTLGATPSLVNFAYDKAGRMISEETAGVTKSYRYGYLDKVLGVSVNKAETAAFTYDATGMLVQKSSFDPGVKSKSPKSTEPWLWDGIALAARGSELYSNEEHVSGGVPLVTKEVGKTEEKFSAHDYLGSTTAELKEDKAVGIVATSFGETEAAQSASADSNRFTGKPFDKDLGAYVFPFRNYRADLGRWTSADPSGFPDGCNGQVYAQNPLTELDSLGLYTTNHFNYLEQIGNVTVAIFEIVYHVLVELNRNGPGSLTVTSLKYDKDSVTLIQGFGSLTVDVTGATGTETFSSPSSKQSPSCSIDVNSVATFIPSTNPSREVKYTGTISATVSFSVMYTLPTSPKPTTFPAKTFTKPFSSVSSRTSSQYE